MATTHPRKGADPHEGRSAAHLLPGIIWRRLQSTPATAPTCAGVPRAGREQELKPPGCPVLSARRLRPRASRPWFFAAMRRPALLLQAPVLAELGGLGGLPDRPVSGGPWRARIPISRLRGRGGGELGASSLGVRGVSPVLR